MVEKAKKYLESVGYEINESSDSVYPYSIVKQGIYYTRGNDRFLLALAYSELKGFKHYKVWLFYLRGVV